MKILQLSTYDQAGGAEKVALDLHRAYRARGHDARLLVRYRKTDEPAVLEANAYAHTSPWSAIAAALDRLVSRQTWLRSRYQVKEGLRYLTAPQRWRDRQQGREDFNYPYAHYLADDPAWRPDVIHAHNLHGNYFDLRALVQLSRSVPVVWTLHDAWALTGHCAYFMDCGRWRSGCGSCPDLRRPPAVLHDRTDENWERKRAIYARSRLAVATPSRWLMQQVEQSMLQPHERRVIPYGVDLALYRPRDRQEARAALGLPADTFICLFIAYSVHTTNPYKDVMTIRRAVQQLRDMTPGAKLVLVAVGERGGETDGQFIYTGYINDSRRVALYYQAADVLLHAASADNFPCVVLEALTCGTPVVATAVGGVGEQIREGETGYLVDQGDSEAMAQRVLHLLQNPDLAQRMGRAAAKHARQQYSLEQHADSYLFWFAELRGLPNRTV